MTSARRGLALLLAGATLLTAAFLALGAWQVQRMGWKHELIARVQARVQAAPVAPPATREWPAVSADPAAFEYRRLRLDGEFMHADEALVQAVTTLGAGFWVLTPLRLADGQVVLVNRGFVPPAQREPGARGAPLPEGPVSVTGLLRITEPGGGFLRHNDAGANRWFSRDVAAIAAARGLPAAQVAPFFVDAEAAPVAGQAWPVAGLTVLKFPDSHLVYALTWFGLAAMTGAAGIYLLRDHAARRRRAVNAAAVPA
ncbi:SURF1 family protein [Hydrogenophaga palleronii]|uniref:SURF1 family protein n=1 Tax=Hydrogenophaga palleronii TaxID=65655 RepID=UPI000824A5BD|nr:SURF1 family protein [Hydrogenophaga palleronii]